MWQILDAARRAIRSEPSRSCQGKPLDGGRTTDLGQSALTRTNFMHDERHMHVGDAQCSALESCSSLLML